MSHQPLTLAFDALLRDPKYAEIYGYLRALMPVDYRDQLDAATTTAHVGFSEMAKAMKVGPLLGLTPEDVPDWLLLGLLDALAAFVAGTASTCLHNPRPEYPEPVTAAAWKPGYVVCTGCAGLLAAPRGSAADKTCDACGHVCEGVEEGDAIFPSAIQFGMLIYQYGTCEPCSLQRKLGTA